MIFSTHLVIKEILTTKEAVSLASTTRLYEDLKLHRSFSVMHCSFHYDLSKFESSPVNNVTRLDQHEQFFAIS